MRGFSVAMSHIVFFVATLLAVAIAVSALSVAIKGISYAMNKKAEISSTQLSTVIKVVDGDADVDQNLIWVYLKNLGETALDVNALDVFVNGRYVSSCNSDGISCLDESNDFLLIPGELAEIDINYPLSPGAYRIRIVTQYGVYADYEVVVG